MKIIKQSHLISNQNLDNNALYFDIETTGFINTKSYLYMIGMFYVQQNYINRIFLFANRPSDEFNLITQFELILRDFDTIYTFNGDSFDIPYLKWRANILNIPSTLHKKKSIDMYKDFKKLKKLLGLKRLNQKSIEEYLGLYRKDTYTGGELIYKYYEYINSQSPELEEIIMLHNINDIEGMETITSLYNYFNIATSKLEGFIKYENEIKLYSTLEKPIPVELDLNLGEAQLNISSYDLALTIPIATETLNHYLPNCKDYYYLPEEDICVLKSIATNIDRKFRLPATKETVRVKKSSCFVCIPEDIGYTIFKRNLKDKKLYIELENAERSLEEIFSLYMGNL